MPQETETTACLFVHILQERYLLSPTYLVEVRVRFGFPDAIEVFHVDELEIKLEARVGHVELWGQVDVWQVAQLLVSPVVQGSNAARIRVITGLSQV